MGAEKGAVNRFALSPAQLDRSQFTADESRLPPNSVQFRPTPSTTGDLSDMERLVQQGSYLNNNVDINSLERSLDVKPTLQHINAYEGQLSSANPMGINPALMTSSASGNRGYPYSNCHI